MLCDTADPVLLAVSCAGASSAASVNYYHADCTKPYYASRSGASSRRTRGSVFGSVLDRDGVSSSAIIETRRLRSQRVYPQSKLNRDPASGFVRAEWIASVQSGRDIRLSGPHGPRQRPSSQPPRQCVPERHRRNRFVLPIPDQERSGRQVFVLHDAIRNEVSCARDGLGDGRVEVGKILPICVFEDPAADQNIEKKCFTRATSPASV